VYAATDYRPRGAERELCERADHTDWLYLASLVALNAGAVILDGWVLKYNVYSSPGRLVGAGVGGLTWGALVSGAYLSLPKCDPTWVSSHPPEGAVRTHLPLSIALSTLAVATAPLFVYIETGPVPLNWPVSERSARVVIPMVTGLLGSLVPYIEFLAPRTWRASRQLERLRLEGAPVPPGGLAPANGFQMGYTVRF